jgi:hypothetical protein
MGCTNFMLAAGAAIVFATDHDGRPKANAPEIRDMPFNTSRRFMPTPTVSLRSR